MDNQLYKVSFIIPVYNVEEYIGECLNSIFEITSFSYELIIIDDGSKDHSIQIVNSICSQKSNVKIVTQENRGLSVARNVGISLATGEYLYFVDSDDKISAANLQLLLREISGNEDIVISNFSTFSSRTQMHENFCRIPSGLHASGVFFLEKYYLKDIYTVVWRNLYRRDFINKYTLRFMEGVTYEDVEWSPRVLCLAESVSFYNFSIYCYRKREGSIVNSAFSLKKFDDIIKVGLSLVTFVVQTHPSPKIVSVIHESIAYFILLALTNVKQQISCRNFDSGIILFKMLYLRSLKYKLLRLLLLFCTPLFWTVLNRKFRLE